MIPWTASSFRTFDDITNVQSIIISNPVVSNSIERYPSQGGNIIGADDVDKYDNNEPPKQGGDDNE